MFFVCILFFYVTLPSVYLGDFTGKDLINNVRDI